MVNGRPIIYESRVWLKWSVLLISWTLPVLILIAARNSKISTDYPDITSIKSDLTQHKNQIGAFNYLLWDSNENYRPICSVRFDNLYPENNKLGFFNTALHKVVKIQNLEIQFYQYSSGKAATSAIADNFHLPDDISADTEALAKGIMRRLTTPVDGWQINIDLGNVSEVQVNNLDYRVFNGDDLFFAVKSRRAVVSYEHSDVVLQGHTKITIADGSTLESNYVNWDVQKQHFSMDGVYVLNRRGIITTGKGICVDAQLKSVEGQYTKSKGKEQKCIAKL